MVLGPGCVDLCSGLFECVHLFDGLLQISDLSSSVSCSSGQADGSENVRRLSRAAIVWVVRAESAEGCGRYSYAGWLSL